MELFASLLHCHHHHPHHHHLRVASPVMDVAIPTSVLHTCAVEDLLIGTT